MHRAAGAVAARLRQVEGFLIHALPGEGRVAVQQDGQHLLPVDIVTPMLARAHRAFDHRIDDLQMRRIERQREMHAGRPAWRCRTENPDGISRRPKSDVPYGYPRIRQTASLGSLPSVLTSTFRRPRCAMPITDSCHALCTGALQQMIQHRNQRVAAFQRKTLLSDILGVQIALQPSAAVSRSRMRFLISLARNRLDPRSAFQTVLYPAFLRHVADVHVFGTDAAAVDAAQDVAVSRAASCARPPTSDPVKKVASMSASLSP